VLATAKLKEESGDLALVVGAIDKVLRQRARKVLKALGEVVEEQGVEEDPEAT